jgi:hypothetical protein
MGLNHRPLAYIASALSTELRAQSIDNIGLTRRVHPRGDTAAIINLSHL